jgi:hypothetical protein
MTCLCECVKGDKVKNGIFRLATARSSSESIIILRRLSWTDLLQRCTSKDTSVSCLSLIYKQLFMSRIVVMRVLVQTIKQAPFLERYLSGG